MERGWDLLFLNSPNEIAIPRFQSEKIKPLVHKEIPKHSSKAATQMCHVVKISPISNHPDEIEEHLLVGKKRISAHLFFC
jgi:hypothetical protein